VEAMYTEQVYKSNTEHTKKKQVAIFADNEKEHVEALAKRLNFDLDMWIRCVSLCKLMCNMTRGCDVTHTSDITHIYDMTHMYDMTHLIMGSMV